MLEAVEERVTPSADPFNLSSLLDANQLFGDSGAVQSGGSNSGNSESREDVERGPQGSSPPANGQARPDTTGGSNGAPVNSGENASQNSQAVREQLVGQGKAHGQIRRFDPEGADAAPTANVSTHAVGASGGSGGTSELSINDVSQSEGDAGTSPMTFTVTRSGDTSQTTTVDYATGNGLAEAGSDYEGTSGTLTFDPGVTSQTISVGIFGDTTVEPDEDFTVLLTNVTNGTIASGSAGIGFGTILNDDAEPLPTVSVDSVSQSEGDSGTSNFTFTVSLSNASSQPVEVQVSTRDGSASSSQGDYQAKSETLTFAPGETTKTFDVVVNGDTEVEPDETFFVDAFPTLNASGGGTGTGTIANDDAEPLPTVSVDSVSQSEGDSGTSNFTFTVSLSNASSQPVEVQVSTRDGSASSSQGDYQAKSETLTFAPGETTKTFDVVVNDDTDVEPDETFFVDAIPTLNASGGGTGTGTILNDDFADQPPTLDPIADQVIDEGLQLSFTVTASDPDSPALTFSLENAPAGMSITSISPTAAEVTWTPTESQGPDDYTFTVKVTDEGGRSDDQLVTVTINEVNLPPVLDPIGDQSVIVGDTLTFTATATDPDIPANPLTFSLDSRAPAGASIDPATGQFTWTPTSGQVGEATFSVQVSDGVLLGSKEITVAVLQAPAAGSISGVLFHDINGNGMDDGDLDGDGIDDEPGLQGFELLLDRNFDGIAEDSTFTDQNGQYRFANVVPGGHLLEVRSRSGWSPTTPPLFVVVDNGQDVTVNFGNFKEGTIAGLIYEDLNRNGQKDANEPAADGQRVFLDIGADTTLDQDFIVGADGQYSFTGLGPGTYQVSLALPAGWEQTTGAPAPISMLSGAFNQVDFGLFDWNNVTFDLDVDNDFRLGNTFFDGTTDGLANYTPGYEGNSAVDLFATGRAGQQVRLVLTNVGKDAGVARVEFEILASTALPGYAVNATDRRIVAGRNDDDFSFRKQTNLRKANIVANLRGPVPRLGQAIHQSLGSIEDNESWVNLWVKDYGGEAIIEARLFDADGKRIQTPRRLLVGIPIDEDGNGMADVWERAKLQEWNQQYQGDVPRTPFGGGGIFFRIEDSEKADPDGANGPLVPQASGGDHIPVIDEYRGFILGGSARFRGAEPSHVRLSPARKEVLLEVDLSHSLPNSDRIALDKYFENARTVYSRVGIDLYWIFQGAFVNEHNLDFENVGGATDLKGHKIGLQTALNVSRGKTTSRGNADLPQFLLDNYKSYFTHVAAVRDIDNLPANVGSFSFDTGMPDRMGVYLVTAGAERLAESVGISDPAEAGGIVLAHEIMHLLISPTKPSAIWDDKEHLAAVPHTELMDWNRTEENLTLATVTVGQATQSELDLVGNPTLHPIRQIRDLRDELK